MKATEFCYWLQGYFEVAGVQGRPKVGLSAQATRCIQQHLALVFRHDIDSQAGPPAYQAELQAIHDGVKPPMQFGGVDADGNLQRC